GRKPRRKAEPAAIFDSMGGHRTLRIQRMLLALLAVFVLAGPALAQTSDVAAGVVGGTITQWDDKKMTVRGVDDEWILYLDPHKTMMMGHPAVDSPVLVWFTRSSDKNLWATRVYIPQT